ncbi:MAG: hypothetical protein HDT06_07300 [Bacteroidales bacterium]|nr:hypothetical protein [Bacteroidales bacterium]
MKKTFNYIGMIVCIMLLSVGFIACSSDDDDKDVKVPIVGTWYLETVESNNTVCYTEMTYKNDGTVTYYYKETSKDGKIKTETDKGTYEVIKDVLRIWWESEDEDEPWSATFTINGNTMTTSENGGTVWHKK